jgi:DNA-binding beta-propeller fold protein YncE
MVLLPISGCSTVSNQHLFKMPGIAENDRGFQLWPSPPAVPRYAFIGHIYGESNRVDTPDRSGLARLLAAIVGLDAQQKTALDLLRPQQVATDNQGKIYITDPGLQSIFVFDEILGEFAVWNERSLNISLPSPIGVAHAEDSVWVTDSELALVYRLSLAGEVINSFGHEVLKRPTGIAYDPDKQRFFVSDTAAGDIKLFSPGGELLDTWGAEGTGEGQFNHPTYLVYRQGRLYVVDSLNARIQILDRQGRFQQSVGHRGLYVGNFSRPKGIALDSDGNIYVSESYYDHVLIYNAQGSLLMSIGGSGSAPGQFAQPTGIWIDDRDRVYVSDMLNSRVSMFQYLGDN